MKCKVTVYSRLLVTQRDDRVRAIVAAEEHDGEQITRVWRGRDRDWRCVCVQYLSGSSSAADNRFQGRTLPRRPCRGKGREKG
jgi:hypothetical protein